MSEQNSSLMDKPRVGLGIIIVNQDGKILVGKRKGNHAPYYSIPGGKLDIGESFEEAAIREVKEETDLDVSSPAVVAVTNNLETYRKEGVHYISVILYTDKFSGEPKITEPEKCEEWVWVDPHNLPEPHFDASKNGVECYLKRKFYNKN